MTLRRLLLPVTAALLLAGCGRTTGPVADLHGTYVLTAEVERGGPAAGFITLADGRRAERRVRYRHPDGSLSPEEVHRGRYVVRSATEVELQLEQPMGETIHTWRVPATLHGPDLVLRYPHPADGWVEERYRRGSSVILLD